jgi:hypothetical protein
MEICWDYNMGSDSSKEEEVGVFMNRLVTGIERIGRIDWSVSTQVDDPSNMALVQEYIRRAALLITTYHLETSYPFFNAARAIGHHSTLDVMDQCPRLGELTNSFMKGTCVAYLEWLSLVESGNEKAIKFHDLYEPLILLIERGGRISLLHGEIRTGGYVFPLANAEYMSKQAPIDISDEGLRGWAQQ